MISIRRTFLAILTAVLSLGRSANAIDHSTDSLETVKKNLMEEKAVIVDVREKSEWDKGHLEGAAHAPLSDLKQPEAVNEFVLRLPKEKIVYTYCAAGVRSLSAGKILEKHAVKVRPLKPGYNDLIEAGFSKAETR